MKVSILMLTHNAYNYVKESIMTIKNLTKGIEYELVVVDNASRLRTRMLLKRLKKKNYIDTLYLNPENALFAKGNNIAYELSSADSDLVLLLNSDITVKSGEWLEKLVAIHPQKGGISAFGVVEEEPVRVDGYCLLINRDLYGKYRLDEQFAWFWSVTKLEAQVLREGKEIRGVKDHEKYLHHWGGRSGKSFRGASGMDVDINKVIAWFPDKSIEILPTI